MNLEPIKKNVTLKEQAYTSIKQAIYSNQLKPGSPLTEEQLSATLSISRTPIRSALQQLVFEKLATADNAGHIYVSKISEKDVYDITVLRLNLEPLAMDLAEFPVSNENIQHLKDLTEQQNNLFKDGSDNNIRFAELDCDFHSYLAQICDNSLLIETVQKINAMMIRILVLSGTLDSYKKKAVEEHKLIIQYLEQEQKEFAKVALQEHIKNVGNRMLPD